jgi:hypothetical protein
MLWTIIGSTVNFVFDTIVTPMKTLAIKHKFAKGSVILPDDGEKDLPRKERFFHIYCSILNGLMRAYYTEFSDPHGNEPYQPDLASVVTDAVRATTEAWIEWQNFEVDRPWKVNTEETIAEFNTKVGAQK